MHKFERAHTHLLRLADMARSKRLASHKPPPVAGPPKADDEAAEGGDPDLRDALESFDDTPAPLEQPKKKR